MKITTELYGTLSDGRQAMLYVLENNHGMRAEITNYGGCLIRLYTPDRAGKAEDIVLAHPAMETYQANPGYFGALVGRNSNRIAQAQAFISGKLYALAKNDGDNNLHSGPNGLSFCLMQAEARIVENRQVLLLTHTIEDLKDGFPGNLSVTVAYELTDDNTLVIDYRAVSDQDTVINLTNHSYFNLAGHASGNVHAHQLQMAAPYFTPNNPECFPTGEVRSVAGTPFDFLQPKAIGADIAADCQQMQLFGGYDHNFVLSGTGYRKIATVTEPQSGRVMEVMSNLPAVQLYTGNNLSDCPGKDGAVYQRHAGFCLETQFVPNAINMPWLMSPIFLAGEEALTSTAFRFSAL